MEVNMETKQILENIAKKLDEINETLKQEEEEENQSQPEEENKQDTNEEEEKKPKPEEEEEAKQDNNDEIKQALAEIKTLLSDLVSTLQRPVEESKEGDVGTKPVNPNPEGGKVTLPKAPTGAEAEENKPEGDEIRVMEKMINDKFEELKKSLKLQKVTTPRASVEPSQYDITKGDEDFALKVARGEAKVDLNTLRFIEEKRRDEALGSIFG